MLSQAALQTHSVSYLNTSLEKHIMLSTKEISEASTGTYGGAPSSESPSWRPTNITMRSSSSPTTPGGSSTEWDYGSTDPNTRLGSNDRRKWSFQPPKHSNYPYFGVLDGLTVEASWFPYGYPSADRHYARANLLPPPSEMYNANLQEYSLCIPPELSYICLGNNHAHPQSSAPLAPRHYQLGHNAPMSGYHSSEISPDLLSPTSTASFPLTAHMSTSSNTPISTVSNNSTQKDYENDGEYVPEHHLKRKSRTSASAKRHASAQYSASPSLHSESSIQRHACPFPSCSLAFARARDLKRHYRLHSGELPYRCDECGRGFIRSDARARHWRAQLECGVNS